MKNNRGMSIVEVLIAVTILAIVIISAAAFMVTGSRSFARGSANSNVQSEAELAVNQVEDLIIDVNGGVEYTVDGAADKEELTMYHVENDDSGMSVYKKRTVTWDRAAEELKSSEWNMDYDSATDTYTEKLPANYENELLAKNVTDFDVDLSDSYVSTAADGTPITIVRSVVIRMDCHDGTGNNVAYATTPVITLRNRLMRSSSPKDIHDQTPTGNESLTLYISDTSLAAALPIVDRVTTVERDNIYNIFAVVSLGTDINDQCDWKVEGATPGSGCLSTIDGSGVLTVSEHEPNDYLTITATYRNDPSKKVTAVVKVGGGGGGDIKSLDSVKIIPESLKPFTPQFDAAPITSGNWSPEELASIDYTWTVSDPDLVESFDNKGKTLNLNIIQEEANYGKVITITLVAHSDVTGQTVTNQISYRIDSKETKPGSGDSNLERGKVGDTIGYHGDNWYGFTAPFYDDNIIYEHYFCDINGNRISAHDDLLGCVVISGGHESYYLSFTKDLPPESEYYIKVIAHYHDKWKGTDWSYERIHYVPAVTLWGETISVNATVNSGCHFYYNVGGYYENAWANSNPPVYEYEVVDLVYDAPEGVEVTAITGGAEAKTVTRIWSRATFDCSDWNKAGSITLKSMTVKITMKGYPNIYTYSTVLFQ